MSLKQIAANRQNARKSTGPKTPEGRAVSKMNALKHGILSKEALVRGWNLKESRRELTALHQRFWDELQPVGPVEEMLVDQIVTAHWRLRRALTAESGEIALSVDEGQRERSRTKHPELQLLELEVSGDPIGSMRDSALGNCVLERLLGEIRQAVEQEGELTEAAMRIPFGGKRNSLTQELDKLRLQLLENPEGLDAASLKQKQKTGALAFLDRKLLFLSWRKADCEKREAREEEARQAAAVLPSKETLDKIQRYETTLQRQLYRALAQLERLQRMRRGEAVPAPLTVEVSERA